MEINLVKYNKPKNIYVVNHTSSIGRFWQDANFPGKDSPLPKVTPSLEESIQAFLPYAIATYRLSDWWKEHGKVRQIAFGFDKDGEPTISFTVVGYKDFLDKVDEIKGKAKIIQQVATDTQVRFGNKTKPIDEAMGDLQREVYLYVNQKPPQQLSLMPGKTVSLEATDLRKTQEVLADHDDT